MNEQTIAEELKAVPMPAELSPTEGFTDEALRRAARGRNRRALTAVVAVVTVLAGATAMMGSGTGAPPAGAEPSSSNATPDIAVPRPGGGPRVVHSFSDGAAAFLLDLRTGEYRGVPHLTATSPDETLVAVTSGERGLGVAERNAYLDNGDAAVTWVGKDGADVNSYVLSGIAEVWSPDGKKVFGATTRLTEDLSTVISSLFSYDVTTGARTMTPVPPGLDIRSLSWAPDSTNYVLSVHREDGKGELRHLSADGALGETVPLEGEDPKLFGVSPGGGKLLYSSEYEDDEVRRARTYVLDLATGETSLRMENALEQEASYKVPVGWVDGDTIAFQLIYLQDRPLELVDAADGSSIRTISWPEPNTIAIWSVGSSAGLPSSAADLGF